MSMGQTGISGLPNENSATIVIRDFHMEDYNSLISLWQEAELAYQPKGRDSRHNIEFQLKQGNTFILVAESSDELIGSVIGTHDGRKGWINRLAVDTNFRRRGLARRLVAEAEKKLSGLGIDIIACLIEEWNTTSMQVFESLGYTHVSVAYYSKRKNLDV